VARHQNDNDVLEMSRHWNAKRAGHRNNSGDNLGVEGGAPMAEFVVFEPGNRFFEPVAAFFASWAGYTVQHAKEKHDTVSGRLRGRVIPQLKFEDHPIVGQMRRNDPVSTLRFEVDMSDPGQPKGNLVKTSTLMEFWSQQMFGHAYESAAEAIQTRFGGDRKTQWPSAFQVAYHVRNGCFHGNRLDIRKNAISTSVETKWRGRVVTYDDNGKKVAGEFFWPGDFITLLYDMQVALA
jgi:hypothetical protein